MAEEETATNEPHTSPSTDDALRDDWRRYCSGLLGFLASALPAVLFLLWPRWTAAEVVDRLGEFLQTFALLYSIALAIAVVVGGTLFVLACKLRFVNPVSAMLGGAVPAVIISAIAGQPSPFSGHDLIASLVVVAIGMLSGLLFWVVWRLCIGARLAAEYTGGALRRALRAALTRARQRRTRKQPLSLLD